MLQFRKTTVSTLLLTLSLVLVAAAAHAQNEEPQATTNQQAPPPGSPSIVIRCNGGNTLLGLGGAIGIKVTFVVNYPNSGCPVVLDCPDVVGDPSFLALRGTGPAVFGCGIGRLRLTGGAGGGNARVYIGGAD